MDSINEKIYNANIQLQDENKVLKQDKKILQKRLDTAIEYMEANAKLSVEDNIGIINFYKSLLKILKGEYFNE